jgi:hypothetical protein
MALQRIGKEDMPRLIADMKVWSRDGAFVQRAVVAGLCEPALLIGNAETVEVLAILDHITRSLAATSDRKHDGFRVLRQALGYGWSVAAAAAPQNARPYLEKWLRSRDSDVAWVMQSNLRKSRMEPLRKSLAARPKPKAQPTPKPKAKAAKPARRPRSGSAAASKPAAARSSRSSGRARRAR